jgi:hypothetical protein
MSANAEAVIWMIPRVAAEGHEPLAGAMAAAAGHLSSRRYDGVAGQGHRIG